MDGQYFFSISEFHVNFKNLECGIWKKKDFFIVFFGKFDRDSQNCLLKMRFGIQNNLNMLNSMAKWSRFSALHWKYPFWANLVQKIKIVCFRWKFVPSLIRMFRIWYWCGLKRCFLDKFGWNLDKFLKSLYIVGRGVLTLLFYEDPPILPVASLFKCCPHPPPPSTSLSPPTPTFTALSVVMFL